MPSRLELYCSGYELSKVPDIKEKIEKSAKKCKNQSSKNRDDVVLTFREYNDMLTKIYYLEHKNEWLHNVNKHLGEEIDSLQKQLLSRKLRKVRCICKLRGKCR